MWRRGRAIGVVYKGPDRVEREIHAKLVLGADGRKSRVAAEVDAWMPYRGSKNGRGFAFRYMDWRPDGYSVVGAAAMELMVVGQHGVELAARVEGNRCFEVDGVERAFGPEVLTPRGRRSTIVTAPRLSTSSTRSCSIACGGTRCSQ